jgi:4-amino-4-deoxy-L-arabinose transferase-like glycosyltransferase
VLKRPIFVPALVCLALLGVFLPIAWFRLIDADEGYYALAARLVLEGKRPYLDFLYVQMPALPYAYGAWMSVVGQSWQSARAFSALAAAVTGALIYVHVRERHDRQSALIAVASYALAGLSLSWMTTVKTYALSTLLVFAAYVIFTRAARSTLARGLVISGVLVGLAVSTRLTLLVVVPAFFIDLVLEKSRPRVRSVVPFALGLGFGLCVTLPFLAADPGAFWFDNVRFHSIRITSHGLFGNIPEKARLLSQLVDFSRLEAVEHTQFLVLLAVALLSATRGGLRKQRLVWMIVGSLVVVSWLPSPPFVQYLTPAVPFLAVLVGPTLASAWARIFSARADGTGPGRPARVALAGAIITGALGYAAVAPHAVYRYTVSGVGVAGVAGLDDAVNWRVRSVDRVTSLLEKRARRRDVVFAWWPGYLLGLDQPRLPKSETHFGLEISRRLEPAEREHYHVLSHAELTRAIEQQVPRYVIVGSWVFRTKYERILEANGYRPAFSVGATTVYGVFRRSEPTR